MVFFIMITWLILVSFAVEWLPKVLLVADLFMTGLCLHSCLVCSQWGGEKESEIERERERERERSYRGEILSELAVRGGALLQAPR